jgi:hypothetical protein
MVSRRPKGYRKGNKTSVSREQSDNEKEAQTKGRRGGEKVECFGVFC